MYGFGSRISGMPRQNNTRYSGPKGAYTFWAIRFLGSETSQETFNPFGGSPANNIFYSNLYFTRVFGIQLITDSGQDIVPLAIDGPILQGVADSSSVYPCFSVSGQDMVYSFRFNRAYRVVRGILDIRYVYNNWLYEYSYNGLDWYPAAHNIALGLGTNRQQIITEFPPWPSFL